MEIVDVSDWSLDEGSGIFPVGARDKEMLWSPELASQPLRPNWPYLFKESIHRYPDQYWTEVVAYIVSKHLGVDVPNTLPAFKVDHGGRREGALIEWFYDVDSERYIPGGSFFKLLIPEFDEKAGTQHNFKDLFLLLRTFSVKSGLKQNYKIWLAEMALFDGLIGNTDRHQENWGVIIIEPKSMVMSPFFDNGTSLGHERFINRVASWTDDQLYNYISKGDNHVRFSRDNGSPRIPHSVLVNFVANEMEWGVKELMLAKLNSIDMDLMLEEIRDLITCNVEQKFTDDRFRWISRILRARYFLMEYALNNG